MRTAPVVLLCLTVAACARKPEVAPPDAAVAAPVVQRTFPPELSLFDRLALEAGRRDHANPSSSAVLEALTRAGLNPGPVQQQLAASVGADFCLKVTAREHLVLSVCEYGDAQRASAGAQTSRTALQEISGRTVDVTRATTLTVIDSQGDAASGEARAKAIAAFSAL